MSLSNRIRPLPAARAEEVHPDDTPGGLKKLCRENGLSLVLFGLFVLFLVGQSLFGWAEHNATSREHGEKVIGYLPYLLTGHFWEAVFENWESEFLQMGAFVVLTSLFYQKGSAESKKLPEEGENPQDEDPQRKREDADAPGPVRRGGPMLRLYERSLCSTLFLFFALSFAGHAVAGAREYSQDQTAHGEPGVTALQYLGTSRFWFESMQNWQSEFLAVLTLVLLSIWLRAKGSPESKPVAAPHHQTGSE
jgi:hypothetical protein